MQLEMFCVPKLVTKLGVPTVGVTKLGVTKLAETKLGVTKVRGRRGGAASAVVETNIKLSSPHFSPFS